MSEYVIYPNEIEFDEIVKKEELVLVDFFATWCGPCKMLGPEIEKLAEEYQGKAKILKVDVDKESGLAAKFQVVSIPTLFVFKHGKQVEHVMGYQPYPALKNMLDRHM